jgi:diguanylate cyclase (GGDEF)-like protein
MFLVLFGINRMGLISDQSALIYNHPLSVSNAVLRINTNLIKIHREMKDIVLLDNIENIKEHSLSIHDYEQQIFNDFEIINERFLGDTEKFSVALREFTEWDKIRHEVIDLMINGKRKEAVAITKGKGAMHVQKVEQAMEKLSSFAQNKARDFLHSTETTKSNAFKMMYVVMGIAVLLVMVLAIFLTRSITRPIEIIKTATDKLGRGKFNTKITFNSKDELGQLATSFNNMAVDLKNITASRDDLNKEIDERKKVEKKLERMAYYDQLTQIPNRAKFLSHINRLLQRTKQQSDYMFAVLFIDLDRFKVINDSLGHEIGDRLLIEIAHRLDTCTRPTDQISLVEENDSVARFGGDEFAVLLHDIKDISSASRVANRIQAELQEPIIIDRHELYTSASIGIAMSATGYEHAEDMLRDADSAMYRAKATGKSRAEIFDEAMHIRVTKILDLEYDLRFAVETEQFIVNYQPIVSATDRRITGAEALIRWDHPEKGVISPQDFIPVAEETGLISDIGEWVLRTACAQSKTWQDAGYPNLLMKVNFSSRQFKDENLTEMVTKVIKETGMPAPLLDIEITENIAMTDSSILILNQLTAMGLQTSIDDFGTGYSSLGSLTKFPINTIKIDKEFIQKIMIDVNAQAIIKAIIAMAHSLHIDVIAEGVETEDELAFLQTQKCDKIQGYIFSRPVPEEDFRKLLEQDKFSTSAINKHSASKV